MGDFGEEIVSERKHKNKKSKRRRLSLEDSQDLLNTLKEVNNNEDEQIDFEERSKKKKHKKKHKHKKLIEEVIGESTPTENRENECEAKEITYELPRIKNTAPDPKLISEAQLHLLIPKLAVLNKKDHRLLKKHNITMQTGRFNKFENAIVLRNWDLYLEDYYIPNPLFLFGYFQYESQQKDVKQYYQTFAQQTHLLLRLANGLPMRTVFQVYCRARIQLSGLKQLKDFTDHDRDIIMDLYMKFGDKYANFCENYGYDPKCAREVVRNRIKANGTKLNTGPWNYEELQKLKSNVEKVMRKYNLDSYERIPWAEVARDMKRSDIQCRQRFFTKIMYIMKNTDIKDWDNKYDLAKLIALLKYCNFSDENLIDWDFIKEKFST